MTRKRSLFSVLSLLAPILGSAECEWSDEFPIPNENKLSFQECASEKKIRIAGIEVQANIDFQIVTAHYPEGNIIWSAHSPDGKTAVVFIDGHDFKRNAWVIDPAGGKVLLFIDHSEGRHFSVEWDDNGRFRVVHAGMGYRTDYMYERVDGVWMNTGHEKLDIKWP